MMGPTIVVATALAALVSVTEAQNFAVCQVKAEMLWNGTNTLGLSPAERANYLYNGTVRGMDSKYALRNRSQFVTLTLQGCQNLCGDPIDWSWQSNPTITLGIISNWVLPIIALLASLPYDSLHRRNAGAPWYYGRIARTLIAIFNWLGSPQTSLTATLFNIHQIRICFLETEPTGIGVAAESSLQSEKRDAYYILSIISQFKLKNPDDPDTRFLETLAYGLFRPMLTGPAAEDSHEARCKTRELLQEMAFQMRMLRRRGVYPSLVSIIVFFVAYAVSLVLAFGGLGDRSTAHSMALGILVSWLPLMVLFTILDRNPVSAERSKKLVTRWLWNAEAIKIWARQDPLPNETEILWWTQDREDVIRENQRLEREERRAMEREAEFERRRRHRNVIEILRIHVCGGSERFHPNLHVEEARIQRRDKSDEETSTCRPAEYARALGALGVKQPCSPGSQPPTARRETNLADDHVLNFVGQGREVDYCGLAHAMVNSVYDTHEDSRQIRPLASIAAEAALKLGGHRPYSWRIISVISLALVWLEIGMAILISYNTPTVGFACRSGSYVVYGGLSTVPWMLHSLPGWKHPTVRQMMALHMFNGLALLALIFIIFANFSGVFNNCVCKTGLTGYMDFANSDFYRDHFEVDVWWTAAAVVGALPVAGSFMAAIHLLVKLKPLWQASEQQSPATRARRANMNWLI